MDKIALIVTTFLRDSLLEECMVSIFNNSNINYIILIGDQNPNKTKEEKYKTKSNVHYYPLDFDCGLSYSRNFLIEKAKELDCKYTLLMADSIMLTEPYNFKELVEFLEKEENNGIIGLDIKGRPSWERDIELVPGEYFWLKKPQKEIITYKNIKFQPCDIVRNFFLAKTECLLEVKWDNDLKTSEHEDFFWRLKNSKWKVFYTSYIQSKYIDYKPYEYDKFRRRMYKEHRNILKNKYNLKGWVRYER